MNTHHDPNPAPGAAPWITPWIDQLRLGASRSAGPVTLVPILGPALSPELMTLSSDSVDPVEVREVGEGGRVARVLVDNPHGLPLLLLDGEELLGAKQNRVVLASTLCGPNSQLEVPVSCIERGRWRSIGAAFRSRSRSVPYSMKYASSRRVRRSLRYDRSFDGDQRATWRDVDNYMARRGALSSTDALSAAFDQDRQELDALRRELAGGGPQAAQIGLAFALRGHLLGVELFGSPALYAQAHERLLHAFFAEALGATGTARELTSSPLELARAVLCQAGAHSSPSTGLGEDHRFSCDEGSGSLLSLDQRPVQASVFASKASWRSALGSDFVEDEEARLARRRRRPRPRPRRAPRPSPPDPEQCTWTLPELPSVSVDRVEPSAPLDGCPPDDDPWGVL